MDIHLKEQFINILNNENMIVKFIQAMTDNPKEFDAIQSHLNH